MARAKAKKTKKKTTARKSARKPAKRAAAKRKTAKRVTAKKRTTKKKTAKKRATTRTTAKKAASNAPTTAIRSALNKSQIMTQVAEQTELSKKEISNVFESLANLMHRHLRKGGAGEFTIPGLMKCVVKHKPATKARRGINPFTGEETTFKAKPARNIVKIRPLKRLKEMADK